VAPPPADSAAAAADGVGELVSPNVAGRRRRREQSLRRRSSYFAAGGAPRPSLAPLMEQPEAPADPPPPPADAPAGSTAPVVSPTPRAPPLAPFETPVKPEPSLSAASGLLGAIQSFDKDVKLRKVRRQSRAFGSRASTSRASLGGRRVSMGPPLPPSGAAGASEDIASVLARAIMNRRASSRMEEEEEGDGLEGVWASSP